MLTRSKAKRTRQQFDEQQPDQKQAPQPINLATTRKRVKLEMPTLAEPKKTLDQKQTSHKKLTLEKSDDLSGEVRVVRP
ncbi:MAG: hypothetical protein ACK559_18375, partial [bacterium]